jgi:hypothetical protein
MHYLLSSLKRLCNVFLRGWSWINAPISPRNFCAVAAGLFTTGMILVGIVNWSINPYGQYSPRWITPIVQDSRSEKVRLFEQLVDQPHGLILGSSRALKFEPGYLEGRTRMSFFNFAVNHGRPEDFLAIVRLYEQTYGSYPKAILLGVDVASLNDTVPSDARLSSEPKLFRHIRSEIPWHEEFDRFSQLFSMQQLNASAKSLMHFAKSTGRASSTRSPDIERFDEDGLIQYLKRQEEMAEGRYDFESALDYNRKEFLAIFSSMSSLSTKRISYLDKLLRDCHARDCKVSMFVTTNHPELRRVLADRTRFETLEQQARSVLSSLAQKWSAKFEDFGRVESFDGDATAFVDGIHPLEPNTRKMIDCLYPATMETRYAVQ